VRNPFVALFERRSIGTSHDLLQYLLGRGTSTVAGQTVNETTAMNVAAVRTGIAIRAELFATLPVDVVEIRGRDRVVRNEHPAARVLSQPNTWQTRSELLAMMEAHRLLRGNAYAWKNLVVTRDGLIAQELIPIHPDQIEVTEDPDDLGAPTTYKLHKKNGQIVTLPAVEVLHPKSLSTNGRTGRSFLTDLREVIGGALATQEHANSLWSRDATPSVVLKHPKTLGPATKENLEASWESIYGRGKDKRRVAVLEEAMEITPISLKPEEGQFLQTKQDLRAEIAAELRIPPFMLGLSEKSTSWGTGIEQQQIGLVVFALRTTATTWEERLQRDLLNGAAHLRFKFNVNATVRGDITSQFQAFWWGVQMGVYSPNDVRALLDMNPTPSGDVYLQPVNLAPLGSDPLKVTPAPTKADPIVVHAPAITLPAMPAITVDARTSIASGAVQVETHASPVTVAPPAVTVEGSEVVIAEGAIRADVHSDVHVPAPPREVRKRVERDDKGRVTGVVEEQV
jgi:HK97 family phage portal protein